MKRLNVDYAQAAKTDSPGTLNHITGQEIGARKILLVFSPFAEFLIEQFGG